VLFVAVVTIALVFWDLYFKKNKPTTSNTKSEYQPDTKGYNLVESAFKPYLEKLRLEGLERGIQFDPYDKQITVRFSTSGELTDDIAGQCRFQDGNYFGRMVLFNPLHWVSFDEYLREMLIFHEFGHCYWDFQHDDRTVNGICTEIMNSGTSDCEFAYNETTRESRLNTFFDDLSPIASLLQFKWLPK
jgi:hypothetical protein